MKKKLLPLAMLAGLAGLAGTAQAVHINPDGLGETLIYPFYSVNENNDTYITVVNTTNQAKAVKVRFLEALNSREVLDFNLYLSPEDHWAATITRDANGFAHLVTADTSCTAPNVLKAVQQTGGVKFRNYEYANLGEVGGVTYDGDGAGDGLERTIEGYVEIIEMGVLDDTLADSFGVAAAVDHGTTGVPANCNLVQSAFIGAGVSGTGLEAGITGTGQWVTDINANLTAPSGGLYGYGVIINTVEGTNSTYSAVALDDFFLPAANHSETGSTIPSLAQAAPAATIIDGVTVHNFAPIAGIDAVSAVFMHDTLSNDYVTEPSILAGTDWVINFPTKSHYVGVDPAIAPFDTPFEGEKLACHEVGVEYWDREEQVPATPIATGGIDFSPMPPIPGVVHQGFVLCSEVAVVSFFGPQADTETGEGYVSAVYPSERIQYGLQPEFNNGWARINFTVDSQGNPIAARELTDGSVTLTGLPVTGFAVQKYTNNVVNSFFSGLIEHKYTRDIQ